MSDAGSTSTTDIKLFQALANPEQTSTFAKPIVEQAGDDDNNTVSSASVASKIVEELPKLPTYTERPPPSEVAPIETSPRAPSVASYQSSVASKQSNAFKRALNSVQSNCSDSDVPRAPSNAQKSVFKQHIPPISTENMDMPPLPKLPSEAEGDMSEDIILEKQSVLLELERLRQRGLRLTKDYTLNDNLTDMQFEMRRHLLFMDEMNAISFMKDAMRLGFTGIELANNKIGPFLDLDGWSSQISSDIGKYDHALSKLYKKYWKRRTSTSPELELAFGIIGSMGMHHFRKKMGNTPLGGMMGSMPSSMNAPAMGSMPPFNTSRFQPNRSVVSESDDEESLPP